MKRPVRWLAGPDGVAHAHLAGGRVTACGVPAIAERFAWPIRSRCPACLAAKVEGSAA